MTEESNKEPHPWANFLDARLKAMVWMRNELDRSSDEIADSLSMDEGQVDGILSSYHYGQYLVQKAKRNSSNETKT